MPNPPILSASRSKAARRAIESFRQLGEGEPEVIAFAPGRVNVIGEHVDYNGGWVLPAALDACVAVALKRRHDGQVNLRSLNIKALRPEFSARDLAKSTERCWSNYVKGVMAGLTGKGFAVPGFDVCVYSDIPVGGGLSSSAALEAVFGVALLELMGNSMDPLELAKLCQKAEHDYAGVPCGLMDQAAVILCQEGHLLLLDCETETYQQAPFSNPDWALLIINSGVAHELADGEYAKRRSACHRAAEMLGVSSLRHVPELNLENRLQAAGLDDEMIRCARHVVTENVRTLALVGALKESDYATAGDLMNQSHRSLSVDYHVSCPELDFIAEIAQSLRGVAGCRMTGGGFGGSAIALLQTSAQEAVSSEIAEAFEKRFGHKPNIFATRPSSGAAAWRHEKAEGS